MKEIMKQTEKTDNKKATLTDAELQQVAAGAGFTATHWEELDCQEQSDKANCEKRTHCKWIEEKNGYHCAWV